MSGWSRSLALDGRDDSLRRWIVLGQLFPTEGLIGVSETSVDDHQYNVVMEERVNGFFKVMLFVVTHLLMNHCLTLFVL